MSYRRTKELASAKQQREGGSPKRASAMSLKNTTQQTVKSVLPPEERWDGIANPSNYFDELPQPYRFINKCLDDLILKPVSEAITKIEERKKTSEYEGFIKEGQATGYLDVDSAVCIERVGTLVGPGGVIDKNEQNTIASKVLVGDNRGQVALLDVSRKTILDKFPVPHLEGRRIVSLSSFSIEWVGT